MALVRRAVCVVAALSLAACGGGSSGQEDAGADASGIPDAEVTPDASPDAAVDPFEVDPQRIYDDVEWLADDARQGRMAGEQGNEDALDYVEALFTALGLQPAGDNGTYRQAFLFDYWSILSPTALEVDGSPLTSSSEYAVMSYSGSASTLAEIVFVGYGLTIPPFSAATYPNCPLDPATGYDDYAGVDVTDKVALVLRHGPGDDQDIYDNCPANAACVGAQCLWNFGYKSANAQFHGAAAVIVVQDYRHAANDVIPGTLDVDYYHADIGAVFAHRGPFETALPGLQTWANTIDASTLPNPVETGVLALVRIEAAVSVVETENLLGSVPGNHPVVGDEVVLLSGHVDHLGMDITSGAIFSGADDNASGTAVMMELARGATHPGFQPARTLLFAAWNGEEEGLYGSCYYVDNPVFPLGDTVAMFSIDMVGAGNGTGVYMWGGNYGPFEWLLWVMQGATADAGLSYSVLPADMADNSDQACFAYAGVTAVMIDSIGPHATYHTPADNIGNILIDDLQVAAEILWATVEVLAMGLESLYTGSPKPADPAPLPRAPANRFTLNR